MVATASFLRRGDSNSGELVQIRSEQDNLKAKLLALEEDKCLFEECYEILAGEKASLEDKVVALDGSMERFS